MHFWEGHLRKEGHLGLHTSCKQGPLRLYASNKDGPLGLAASSKDASFEWYNFNTEWPLVQCSSIIKASMTTSCYGAGSLRLCTSSNKGFLGLYTSSKEGPIGLYNFATEWPLRLCSSVTTATRATSCCAKFRLSWLYTACWLIFDVDLGNIWKIMLKQPVVCHYRACSHCSSVSII